MNARPRARLFTHLWFAGKAEEAVRFYAGLFPESSLDAITTLPGDASDGTPPRCGSSTSPCSASACRR